MNEMSEVSVQYLKENMDSRKVRVFKPIIKTADERYVLFGRDSSNGSQIEIYCILSREEYLELGRIAVNTKTTREEA